MFWIVLGALVLLYCLIVNIKLGKIRFSAVSALLGVLSIGLGVLLILFPEQPFVWVFQFAATIILTLLIIVDMIVIGGIRKKVPDSKPDYTIVLGCSLKKADQMTTTLQERLTLAKELHDGEPIVLSGGQTPGKTISEAYVMAHWMAENGVDRELLITENLSLNTKQNLQNCRALLSEQDERPFEALSLRIITSDFHLWRTRRLAEECGYENAVILGSSTLPLIAPLYHLREVLAIIYGIIRKR